MNAFEKLRVAHKGILISHGWLRQIWLMENSALKSVSSIS